MGGGGVVCGRWRGVDDPSGGADHEDEASVLALFREAAEEQGIFLPGQGEEFPGLERWICGQVVAGKMGPPEGLSLLNWICVESLFDRRFARWLYLAESIVLLEEICGGLELFEEMTLETVDETILREARVVVSAGSTDANGVPPSQDSAG